MDVQLMNVVRTMQYGCDRTVHEFMSMLSGIGCIVVHVIHTMQHECDGRVTLCGHSQGARVLLLCI